jgi:hypothetical protein
MSLRGDKYEKHTYFQNFNFFGVNTWKKLNKPIFPLIDSFLN